MATTRYIQLLSLGFVAFLVAPAVELAGLDPAAPVAALAWVGLAAFGALFARVVWRHVASPQSNRTPWALAGMAVLAAGLQTVLGQIWLQTASYVLMSLVLLSLPRRWWLAAFPALFLGDVAAGLLRLGQPAGQVLLTAAAVQAFGVLIGGFYWIAGISAELRAARAELARSAIAGERLRIARDLHDVLGQRLTEVILRAELSARLAQRDPGAAGAEMAAVGAVAREILDEVRATVSGYRDVSLAGELATAREVTRAAGVDLSVDLPEHLPEGSATETAAWVVREGVTNVLRHTKARTCAVTIHAGDALVVTVTDDGPGVRGPVRYGTGLTGLAERVAASGGRLEVDAGDATFTLRATIPQAAHLPGQPAAVEAAA
jgi:two-component system sensor histidine kinase DesK